MLLLLKWVVGILGNILATEKFTRIQEREKTMWYKIVIADK